MLRYQQDWHAEGNNSEEGPMKISEADDSWRKQGWAPGVTESSLSASPPLPEHCPSPLHVFVLSGEEGTEAYEIAAAKQSGVDLQVALFGAYQRSLNTLKQQQVGCKEATRKAPESAVLMEQHEFVGFVRRDAVEGRTTEGGHCQSN